MATKSFVTDYPINKRTAGKISKALQKSKPLTMQIDKRVIEVKSDQLRTFFGKE